MYQIIISKFQHEVYNHQWQLKRQVKAAQDLVAKSAEVNQYYTITIIVSSIYTINSLLYSMCVDIGAYYP